MQFTQSLPTAYATKLSAWSSQQNDFLSMPQTTDRENDFLEFLV